MSLPPLAFLTYGVAALLAVAALALTRAEERDPEADPFKRLNLMLARAIASVALFIISSAAIYAFGLVWPVLAALALYGIYRMLLTRDLRRFYRFNYAFGIAATLGVVVAISNITLSEPVIPLTN